MPDDLKPAPRGYPIKLVRDKTPDVINKTGKPGELFYAELGFVDVDMLCKKLMEETAEYIITRGDDELLDIMAVIEALAIAHEWPSIEAFIEDMKSHPRGGFTKGVMMYGLHPEFDCD